jgi:Txe/YoeB family toxin of Txe-Axe toxin-antitoxin module
MIVMKGRASMRPIISSNWRDDPMTGKQMTSIEMIHANTKHRFNGNTKGAASDFIGKYVDESKESMAEMWRRVNEEERHLYRLEDSHWEIWDLMDDGNGNW